MSRADAPAGPRLRLRFTPSGLGWLAVAALVGAYVWFKSINMVLVVAYAMVMLAVLNGVLAWRAVRRTTAKRIPIPPVFAGERAECGVLVTNGSSGPITVTVSDRAGADSNTFLIYRLPAGQPLMCTASRELPRRGRFGGPVSLFSGFPFGFIECEREDHDRGEIVVLPRLGYAEPDGLRRWLFRQSGEDGRARRVQRRLTTDAAEVRGVRAYRPGDAIRDIHWRSSARRGEPMVREYDTAPSPELVVVVEPWLPEHPTHADRERLEEALSLAATIAMTWRRAFDNAVSVVVAGRTAGAVVANSEEDLREALTPLADAEGAPAHTVTPGEVFNRHLARSARVVVSSRPRTPFAAALGRSCGRPFIAVSPADRLPWYLPPTSAK